MYVCRGNFGDRMAGLDSVADLQRLGLERLYFMYIIVSTNSMQNILYIRTYSMYI